MEATAAEADVLQVADMAGTVTTESRLPLAKDGSSGGHFYMPIGLAHSCQSLRSDNKVNHSTHRKSSMDQCITTSADSTRHPAVFRSAIGSVDQ